MHAPFIIGNPHLNSELDQIAIVISTENLLLNAWRVQAVNGQPLQLEIDTEYRLVYEARLARAPNYLLL